MGDPFRGYALLERGLGVESVGVSEWPKIDLCNHGSVPKGLIS